MPGLDRYWFFPSNGCQRFNVCGRGLRVGWVILRVRRAGFGTADMAAPEAGAAQPGPGPAPAPAEPELEPLRLRRLRGDGFFEIPAADRVSARGCGRARGRRGVPVRGPRGGTAWTHRFGFSWDGAAA